jgi:predicted extracellular nuclease
MLAPWDGLAGAGRSAFAITIHHEVPMPSLGHALFVLLTLTLAAVTTPVRAQVAIEFPGVPAAQDFDQLARTGTGNAWLDNVTLPGWYASRTTYNANNGGSNTGAMYSYGATNASDRALGSLASGGTGTVFYGLRIGNAGAFAWSGLAVSYTGEQWRAANVNPHTLAFEFQVAPAGDIIGINNPATGWIAAPALNFVSPNLSTVGAIDGNAPENRSLLAGTVSASVPPGHEIWIRWRDIDDPGADHGLAIDDLEVVPLASGGDIFLNVLDTQVAEGAEGELSDLVFSVRLSAPAVEDVGFAIATTTAGSAVPGVDFEPDSAILVIPAGETSAQFPVTVYGNDLPDGNRTVVVEIADLVSDDANVRFGRQQAVGTILDDDPVLTSICAIQASGYQPSPFLGDTVTVLGVVTAIIGNGYFVQYTDAQRGADALCSATTSSGLFVFKTGSFDPDALGLAVGQRVRVTGQVAEFLPVSAQDQFSLRQLGFASTEILAGSAVLPTPVALDPLLDLAPETPAEHLYRYLGMRVAAPPLRVSGPGLGSLSQANASVTPNGVFFAAPALHPRPLREPGVDVVDRLVDVVPFPPTVNPPLFDGNPEVLRVDSAAQRDATPIDLETGALLVGLRGVLSYGFKRYTLMPDPDAPLLVDESGVVEPRPVRAPAYEEFTVASFNVLNLEDFPALTLEALTRRLDTLSRAICQDLGTPDVLGLIELGSLSVLEKLRDAINGNQYGHCDFDPQYSAHFTPPTFAGMGTGYLIARYEVAPGVTRVAGSPYAIGGTEVPLITPQVPPNVAALFDRPPFVLDATVQQDNGASYPITVVLNHLRSLLSLTDPRVPGSGSQTAAEGWATNGHRVREKRLQGAAWLADWIQQRQLDQPETPILVMGDLNAFEFSDGYVDVVGILKGQPAPPDQVLLARSEIPGSDPQLDPVAVDPPLLNLVEVLPEGERYSFVFAGSAQTLDHILVSEALLDTVDALDFDFARINADFAASNFSQPAAGRRTSDHDPAIAFLAPPAFRSADLAVTVTAERSQVPPSLPAMFTATLDNPGPNHAEDVTLSLRVSGLCPDCPVALDADPGWTCGAFVEDGDDRLATCTSSSLPVSTSSVAVSAGLDESLAGETVGFSAQVTSATADRTPQDNEAETTIAVLPLTIFGNGFES